MSPSPTSNPLHSGDQLVASASPPFISTNQQHQEQATLQSPPNNATSHPRQANMKEISTSNCQWVYPIPAFPDRYCDEKHNLVVVKGCFVADYDKTNIKESEKAVNVKVNFDVWEGSAKLIRYNFVLSHAKLIEKSHVAPCKDKLVVSNLSKFAKDHVKSGVVSK